MLIHKKCTIQKTLGKGSNELPLDGLIYEYIVQ